MTDPSDIGDLMTREELIYELRKTMGTTNADAQSPGWTTISNISTGLKQFSAQQGYLAAQSTTYTDPSFSTMKSHLQNIGPTEISVTGHDLFGGHSIVGIGTVEYTNTDGTAGHKYLIIHDNGGWGGTADAYMLYGSHYTHIYDATYRP